jgi:DNA ligase-1
MAAFAEVCDAVAATPAKSLKIERLAEYLRRLEPADLAPAARFLTGNPLPAYDDRKIAIGGRTIVAAAAELWGLAGPELSLAYRGTGDLGEALARLARDPARPSLFAEELTPASFAQLLDEIATASGKAAGKRREALCVRVLRACRSDREVAYVVKILTGELRIGLREGLVLDAIAAAFERDAAAVRRAAMAAGDVGAVALAARAGTLKQIEVRYGAPIGFMLASPVTFGSSYRELDTGSWLVEDKYDGIRVQAHVRAGKATLFSRTFSDVARAFPEVATALAGGPDAIFDGEIVARRDDGALPFRYLQPRLQRVDPSEELRAEVPVAFVAFDILAAGSRFLLEAPLADRRVELAAALRETEHVRLAPWQALETGAPPERIHELFDAARERGNEGLMLKRGDSPYAPGRRGKWWLKLKRELSTLDAVVTRVEWGHGKRKSVLSDYTFAVRRSAEDPELLAIGKAYSGLTDAEIAEMTEWFLAHRIGEPGSYGFAVEPSIVVEIAFDIIQPSTLHASGFSLRFPRIARLRPDKLAAESDTLADVERIYAEMLEREGVAR